MIGTRQRRDDRVFLGSAIYPIRLLLVDWPRGRQLGGRRRLWSIADRLTVRLRWTTTAVRSFSAAGCFLTVVVNSLTSQSG